MIMTSQVMTDRAGHGVSHIIYNYIIIVKSLGISRTTTGTYHITPWYHGNVELGTTTTYGAKLKSHTLYY